MSTTIRKVYLTTIDNPFNPSTQFEEWLAFDESKGYCTCGYLARIAKVSEVLSEADYTQAIESAIDEIVRLNVFGVHQKIVEEVEVAS